MSGARQNGWHLGHPTDHWCGSYAVNWCVSAITTAVQSEVNWFLDQTCPIPLHWLQAVALLQRVARVDDAALRTAAKSAVGSAHHHVASITAAMPTRNQLMGPGRGPVACSQVAVHGFMHWLLLSVSQKRYYLGQVC